MDNKIVLVSTLITLCGVLLTPTSKRTKYDKPGNDIVYIQGKELLHEYELENDSLISETLQENKQLKQNQNGKKLYKYRVTR